VRERQSVPLAGFGVLRFSAQRVVVRFPPESQATRSYRVMRLDIVILRLMKTRSSRSMGSLFAFFVLAGCAMPPNAANEASNPPLSTKSAQAGGASTIAPQAFGTPAPAASAPEANGTSLADAQPLTDTGPTAAGFHETGRASWYGRFFHGRRTANGERYDMHALTAAHRTLPLGSYVRVTNPADDSSVIVRINDRGPFARGRVIDLSLAAATALHMAHAGTARVQIEGLTQQQAKAEQAEMLASNSSDVK
jgi:rare lipoprotein A